MLYSYYILVNFTTFSSPLEARARVDLSDVDGQGASLRSDVTVLVDSPPSPASPSARSKPVQSKTDKEIITEFFKVGSSLTGAGGGSSPLGEGRNARMSQLLLERSSSAYI